MRLSLTTRSASFQNCAIAAMWLTVLVFDPSWPRVSAQSSSQSVQEWDAVEAGLVDLLARGNAVLRRPPAIQIVSPPVTLDYGDPENLRRSLVEMADEIPQWGPYFEPSGRTVRKEFRAFLDSIDSPTPWPDGTQPPIPADSAAYRFNPDLPELARKNAALLPPGKIQWEAQTNSGVATSRSSSKRIRLRIGPLGLRGSAAGKQQELDSQLAEGVFSASGLSLIGVVPGPWFSSRFIDRFAKGPFKSGGGAEAWWGPKGRLSLYPRSLVIVSDPSFSLRLDSRSYRQVRLAIAGGASIGVGPFQMTPSGTGKAEFSFDDKLLTITAKRSSRAVIIAVINQVNNLP